MSFKVTGHSMYFKITRKKDDMTEMICFYCTSFLSFKHVVVHIIPNIIMTFVVMLNDG